MAPSARRDWGPGREGAETRPAPDFVKPERAQRADRTGKSLLGLFLLFHQVVVLVVVEVDILVVVAQVDVLVLVLQDVVVLVGVLGGEAGRVRVVFLLVVVLVVVLKDDLGLVGLQDVFVLVILLGLVLVLVLGDVVLILVARRFFGLRARARGLGFLHLDRIERRCTFRAHGRAFVQVIEFGPALGADLLFAEVGSGHRKPSAKEVEGASLAM